MIMNAMKAASAAGVTFINPLPAGIVVREGVVISWLKLSSRKVVRQIKVWFFCDNFDASKGLTSYVWSVSLWSFYYAAHQSKRASHEKS